MTFSDSEEGRGTAPRVGANGTIGAATSDVVATRNVAAVASVAGHATSYAVAFEAAGAAVSVAISPVCLALLASAAARMASLSVWKYHFRCVAHHMCTFNSAVIIAYTNRSMKAKYMNSIVASLSGPNIWGAPCKVVEIKK